MRFNLGQRDDGEGRDNMSALSRDASDLLWVLPSLTCGSSRERVSFPVVRGFEITPIGGVFSELADQGEW
jgi:hypothetical protein